MGIELQRQNPWPPATSDCARILPPHCLDYLAEDNLNIEPHRPVLDVPQVILCTFLNRRVATQTINLCPAGHSGLLAVAFHVTRNVLAELGDEVRLLRSW